MSVMPALDPGGDLLDVAVERGLPGGFAQHRIEHLLGGKGVCAAACRGEEIAVALPSVVLQADPMAAVIAGKGGLEPLEPHAVGLMRVAHRLLDLADDARLHDGCPPGAEPCRRHLFVAPVSP